MWVLLGGVVGLLSSSCCNLLAGGGGSLSGSLLTEGVGRCRLLSERFIGSFWGSGHGGVALLLYRFHRVSLDISRGFRGDVALGGDEDPCRGGVAAELRSSLLSSLTYSTIRASNSDGASPGTGPAEGRNFLFLVLPRFRRDYLPVGICPRGCGWLGWWAPLCNAIPPSPALATILCCCVTRDSGDICDEGMGLRWTISE